MTKSAIRRTLTYRKALGTIGGAEGGAPPRATAVGPLTRLAHLAAARAAEIHPVYQGKGQRGQGGKGPSLLHVPARWLCGARVEPGLFLGVGRLSSGEAEGSWGRSGLE